MRTFTAIFSTNFLLYSSGLLPESVNCEVIATNVFVRNKQSMTRVTNYVVTNDIINTVQLTKPVLLAFKMVLIIY